MSIALATRGVIETIIETIVVQTVTVCSPEMSASEVGTKTLYCKEIETDENVNNED